MEPLARLPFMPVSAKADHKSNATGLEKVFPSPRFLASSFSTPDLICWTPRLRHKHRLAGDQKIGSPEKFGRPSWPVSVVGS